MKKLAIVFSVALMAMFATSCFKEEYHPEALEGHWVLAGESKDDGSKSVLALTFENGLLWVDGASSGQRPFTMSDEWEYYMTRDSVLVITYEYYDSEDYLERDSYDLKMSFRDDDNTLILVYDPLIGSTKRYTFYRR
ncbi:MAG: hypothetical protein J6X86_08400 [Bacteroidales bacterium]|nr:hypothetical protein [Bacteroidales bacterium]